MPAERRFGPGLLALLLGSILVSNAVAADWEAEAGIQASVRFGVRKNFLNPDFSLATLASLVLIEDPQNLRFNRDEMAPSLFLRGMGELAIGASRLRVTLDSGELKAGPLLWTGTDLGCNTASADPRCDLSSNGRAIADEARATGFLREAYLDHAFGESAWFEARAGKFLASTGGGFLLDNYVLGAEVALDLELGFGIPARGRLDLLLANGDFTAEGKQSPFVYAEAAWLVSFMEEWGMFFAAFHDGDDNLAEVVRSILGGAGLRAEGPAGRALYWIANDPRTSVRTRGDLFWVGTRGQLIFDKATFSFTGILGFGRFDIVLNGTGNLGQQIHLEELAECLGGLVDLNLHVDLADWLTVGAFFLFMSGDTATSISGRGAGGRYGSFLSVLPYITRTNIFFSGGMNQDFSWRGFSPSGVNGRGVIAPGLNAGADLGEDLLLRVVLSALWAHGAHQESGERFYGFEADCNLEWTPLSWLRVLLEADLFVTGPFFDFSKPLEVDAGLRVFSEEPTAYKILLGIDLSY